VVLPCRRPDGAATSQPSGPRFARVFAASVLRNCAGRRRGGNQIAGFLQNALNLPSRKPWTLFDDRPPDHVFRKFSRASSLAALQPHDLKRDEQGEWQNLISLNGCQILPRFPLGEAVLSVAVAVVVAELITRLLNAEAIVSSMLCAVIFAAWLVGAARHCWRLRWLFWLFTITWRPDQFILPGSLNLFTAVFRRQMNWSGAPGNSEKPKEPA